MGASTGHEARVRAARKLRASVSITPSIDGVCRFCKKKQRRRFLRWAAEMQDGDVECRGIAVCEERMK